VSTLYDRIGGQYAAFRQPDARIADAVQNALGDSRSVVNVGAGTGSYEPADRRVIAVEPSWKMLKQRRVDAAPVVQGDAAALPLFSKSVDAALAVLTIHHWLRPAQGIRELKRVARHRVVILTWDPASPGFWLTNYFPEILEIDRRIFPEHRELNRLLGETCARAILIPHDCTDGFLGAYWRRPEAYLDPGVRASMSTFSKLATITSGLAKLSEDLQSGEWHDKYGDVLAQSELDLGYRLLIAHLDRA
jgi:SAM-dependent methyltransferase